MAPDEFGQRLEQARRELEAAGAQVLRPVVQRSEVAQRAELLHRLRRESHEPRLDRGTGVRGWLVFNIKRVVRKLARWYVEPRWIDEQEYDVELASFATEVGLQIEALERRVVQLEESNGRLARQVRLFDRTVRAHEVA